MGMGMETPDSEKNVTFAGKQLFWHWHFCFPIERERSRSSLRRPYFMFCRVFHTPTQPEYKILILWGPSKPCRKIISLRISQDLKSLVVWRSQDPAKSRVSHPWAVGFNLILRAMHFYEGKLAVTFMTSTGKQCLSRTQLILDLWIQKRTYPFWKATRFEIPVVWKMYFGYGRLANATRQHGNQKKESRDLVWTWLSSRA